ncbi:MAG: GIY-YIG nuclease family protein [Planctomycetota bacterium]
MPCVAVCVFRKWRSRAQLQPSTMFVYFLKSLSHPSRRYIGLTTDIEKRLREHNAGKSPFTAPYVPWKMVASVWFDSDEKARNLERYLKHGSGHAFANRHFW